MNVVTTAGSSKSPITDGPDNKWVLIGCSKFSNHLDGNSNHLLVPTEKALLPDFLLPNIFKEQQLNFSFHTTLFFLVVPTRLIYDKVKFKFLSSST